MKSIVILISGRGSNMQAIVDAGLPARIAAVISNRADAAGLAFARSRGIATEVIDHRDYFSREAFDAALLARIEAHHADLVVLAGFMRVLTPQFVEHFEGRLINIHPSLLPKYPGLDTHRRALDARDKKHGCTVHFVTTRLDHGPIIAQAEVPVLDGDTPETLAARVLEQEHRILPLSVRWFLEGSLTVENGEVRVAGNAAQQFFHAAS